MCVNVFIKSFQHKESVCFIEEAKVPMCKGTITFWNSFSSILPHTHHPSCPLLSLSLSHAHTHTHTHTHTHIHTHTHTHTHTLTHRLVCHNSLPQLANDVSPF